MSDPLVSDHREFIAEARKRCAMSIRNTAVGDWLRDALRRLEETEAENERLREALEQASEPLEAEQARWQHAIADKIAEFVPDVCADGCDSGDPLDWSLAEIGIALQTALETKEQATEPLTRERLKEFAKDNPPPDSWFEEEQASEVLEQIAERLRLRRRTHSTASLAVFICSRCRESVDTVYEVGSGANVEHVCVKCVDAH